MKTSLVFKGIEVAGVKIGEVAVAHEYSATEAIQLMMGGKDFIKSFIKDIPEMANDLKKAYDTVQTIENEEMETAQYDDSVEVSLKKMDITYKYCIQAIKNATCEAVINEVVDHARAMMNSADYATIVYTAIQRKQEIGIEPFM